jgi:hypothetical protein
VQNANEQTPFGYRLDIDGEFATLVPTTTRDAKGDLVRTTPLLDHGLRGELHVTLEEGSWAGWLHAVLQPHV